VGKFQKSSLSKGKEVFCSRRCSHITNRDVL